MTTLNTVYRNRLVRCSLQMTKDWHCDVRITNDLLPESLAYAAMRLISKSPDLQARLVPVSYQLRFAKKRRPRRITLKVPGQALCLPEGTALLRLSITAEGISIDSIRILPDSSPAVRLYTAEESVLLWR